jgi:hypothetical protein
MPLSQWKGDDGSCEIAEVNTLSQPSPIKGEGADMSS